MTRTTLALKPEYGVGLTKTAQIFLNHPSHKNRVWRGRNYDDTEILKPPYSLNLSMLWEQL